MSRKTYTFIIIIVLIILGAAAWWFLSHENSAPTQTAEQSTDQNLFPYGQNATSSSNISATNQGQRVVVVGGSSTTPPTLIQITTTPVSGMIFLPENANSSTTILRYVDRATGHIYDYSFDTGTSTEITNTTVPKVYQAVFSSTGSRVYLETLDENNEIETMSASVGALATTGPASLTDVTFLPKNIITISPNGSSLFYLVPGGQGSIGYVSALDDTKPVEVLDSGLSELVAHWQSNNVGITTKASSSAGGYFFDLNTKTGAFTPVIDNILGLTALENSAGTFVFGSSSSGGTVESFMYNEKENSTRTIPLSTLADKCVWSTLDSNTLYCAVPTSIEGNLPDDWYQGNVFLPSDNIWKVTADTGVTNIVDFLSDRNANIDAENLTLDTNEKWLVFMDKEDLSLWALRIGQ